MMLYLHDAERKRERERERERERGGGDCCAGIFIGIFYGTLSWIDID